MFKKISIQLSQPICFCLEQDLSWRVTDTQLGHGLEVACKSCGVSIVVPPAQFKASFALEVPYPGKPKPKIPVVIPKPGDVVDMAEYIKRKREREPAS